jgi:type VI secretion system protein ImpG
VFERYYQTELSYLRETSREFAGKHPALAGMLTGAGTDPDVERLLEGVAFLTAGFRQRIDDSYPELIEGLSELLCPHIVRPTPACTILELRSTVRGARGRTRIAAGSRVLSRPVQGSSCTFVTSRAVDILPLRLTSSRVDESWQSRPTLTVDLEVEGGSSAALPSDQPLRFHLAGDPGLTAQLLLWLGRHLSGVSVVFGEQVIELPTRAVRMVGFSDDDPLFPWPSFSPHGARLLLEYFALPGKFMFFDVHGWERVAAYAGARIQLVFRFASPPALPARMPEDTLRLHCVPACNVFEADADPIRVSLDERPVLLRAAGVDPSAMEVFSVCAVTGASKSGERRTYAPFHAFGDARKAAGRAGLYVLSRQASPVDDGVHTYIAVQPPQADNATDEVLSIRMLCTNRCLVSGLQHGDVSVPTPDIAPGIVVRNIGPVSSPVRPALGSARPWNLLSHLSCSRRSLSDVSVLKSLLSLYCAEDSHQPCCRANLARIEAIRAVRVATVTRTLAGSAATGSHYFVELDQCAFLSNGDAFAFGLVLRRLFDASVQLNTFADVSLELLPSGLTFRYDAGLAQ